MWGSECSINYTMDDYDDIRLETIEKNVSLSFRITLSGLVRCVTCRIIL